jgi:hypothetical protein
MYINVQIELKCFLDCYVVLKKYKKAPSAGYRNVNSRLCLIYYEINFLLNAISLHKIISNLGLSIMYILGRSAYNHQLNNFLKLL